MLRDVVVLHDNYAQGCDPLNRTGGIGVYRVYRQNRKVLSFIHTIIYTHPPTPQSPIQLPNFRKKPVHMVHTQKRRFTMFH